jgi:glycosyltransferase involved in cell wall biosynthesis
MESFLLMNRIDVAISSNSSGMALHPLLHKMGVKMLVIPYGLITNTIHMLRVHAGGVDNTDAFIAYPRIAGGMEQINFAPGKLKYTFRGFIDPVQYSFRDRFKKSPIHVAYVGRLSPEKDLGSMCSLVLELDKKIPLVFHLVGGIDPNGPELYAKYFQDEIDRLHKDPRYIELKASGIMVEHGLLNKKELLKLYTKLDALLITSEFEGEPCVFLEAMASGILCVGRGVGEIPSMLNDCGISVKTQSRKMSTEEITTMVDEFVSLIEDPLELKRRIRKAADKVHGFYGPKEWVSDFEAICWDVLHK